MAHDTDSQTGTSELIPESEPLWFIDTDARCAASASRPAPDAGVSTSGTPSAVNAANPDEVTQVTQQLERLSQSRLWNETRVAIAALYQRAISTVQQ